MANEYIFFEFFYFWKFSAKNIEIILYINFTEYGNNWMLFKKESSNKSSNLIFFKKSNWNKFNNIFEYLDSNIICIKFSFENKLLSYLYNEIKIIIYIIDHYNYL